MDETPESVDEPVLLDPSVDVSPELGEHPDEITDAEAASGLAMYHAVDDLDDNSNGFEVDPDDDNGPMPRGVSATSRAKVIRECLLRHGVPEVSIELQIGRPASGDRWNACNPVALISHHIASTPTVANPTPGLSLVKRGRSDLAGPLANGTAGVDLVYRILTLGLANHPGVGGPWTVRGPLGSYTIPKDVARPYAWGTEYEGGYTDAVWDKTYTNKRTGKSMTFREFMGRCNAGLAEAMWLINGHGKTATAAMDLSGYHGEHKTWAPGRKVDRHNYTTNLGRAEIQRYNHQEDDDMPLNDADKTWIKDAVKGVVDDVVDAKVRQFLGDVVHVPSNEDSWAPTNTEVSPATALSHNMAKLRQITDKLGVTTPKA